jgi:acyl transferase domain-containing protein
MARELRDASPAFAARLDECAAALAPYVRFSLPEVLDDAAALDRVDVVQPALFAVMVSLAALWRSYGVEPAAVLGHSQGEIAAAVVAGALTLEDGARVVALRSRAIAAELAGRGGMLSIAEPAEDVRARLTDFGELSVAALNGPASTVVAGDPAALRALAADCERRGVRTRAVPVDYASHSAHVEDIRAQLLAELGPVAPRPADVPLFSTVTQDWLDTSGMDAGYWYRNLRETVRFEGAVRALAHSGYGAFIEVSAHPVLVPAIQETVADGEPVAVTGSLRRDDGGLRRMTLSVAEAFVHGVPVDWTRVLPDRGPVDLPTYAFRRQRYWWDPALLGAPPVGSDPAEAAFWQAIEEADTGTLAATLGVDGEPLGQVLPALTAWRHRQREEATVDSWRYRFEWAPLPAADEARLSGTWWLLAADDLAITSLLRDGLLSRGADAVAVVPVAATDDRAALTSALEAAHARHGEPAGILSLLALAGHTAEHEPAARTAALIQALGAVTDAPLWCATRGAGPGEPDPAQAAVWGLGRVAALEHPDRWGGLLDLPEPLDRQSAERVAGLLAGDRGEDQAAVRAGGVFGRRLRHSAPATTRDLPIAKTVLITGGTGALGRNVARWLLGSGTEHVVLASRRGESAPELTALRTEFGVRISAPACDVADREQLAALLAEYPVDGVVHAAGVLDDGVIEALTPERFAAVFAPKARAARHLDELTRDRDLKYFVLFSSAAGAIGNAGQGNYAAANAYLDALAERRHRAGLPATSIAWGAWAGDGLAAGALGRMDREGVPTMAPEQAVTALGRVLRQENPVEVVARFDWARMLAAAGSARPVPALAELPEVLRLSESGAAAREDAVRLAERLTALPPADRAEEVTRLVRTHVAAVLGHRSPDGVEPRRAFKELGLDSLTAVELRNRLTAATGLRLPASVVFDHPTVAALAERLCAGLAPASGSTGELTPFDALDRIELSLADTRAPERALLRQRLAGLLARCEEPTATENVSGGLLVASDDEVFDFIGKEFGIS